MALLVKKFGGTSVGDIKKIQNIASSICQSKEAGNEIVIVVSAMGKTTDDLNMALLVKKFGGTSVGDIKKIQNIASSICQSKEAGNEIVVVVSAMGQTTDLSLIHI